MIRIEFYINSNTKYDLKFVSVCIILLKVTILNFTKVLVHPIMTHQGHGRIGGHYFHTGCPYVRHKNKTHATTDTMCVDNDYLLAVAWWVTLKSPDLYCNYIANCNILPPTLPACLACLMASFSFCAAVLCAA